MAPIPPKRVERKRSVVEKFLKRYSSSEFTSTHELPPKPTLEQVVEKAIELRKHHHARSIRGFIASEFDYTTIPHYQNEKERSINENLRKDAEKRHGFMFHPTCGFMTVWTFVSIILLTYISLTVPVFIAFSSLSLPSGYIAMDAFIDLFYLIDIVIIFRTGIIPDIKRPDFVIMDPKIVAKNYILTWFIIDLLCGIPFATISLAAPSGLPQNELKLGKLLKMTKLLRIIKLSKLGKANMFVDKIDEAYLELIVSHPRVITVLRMLSNLFIAFFVIHYVTCCWWVLGRAHDNSWIIEYGANNLATSDQYLYSMYWVITTMTTVGYGDISPVNGSERGFGIFVMVMGCALYGLLIAQITSIVGEYEANRRMIAEKLDAVAIYIHKKNLNPKLRKQILVYFRHFLQKNSIIDEGQMLQDLSSRLREKVILHLVSSVVTNNPFFVKLDHHITDVFSIMHLQIFHRGQHIAHKGEQSEDMMMLFQGRALVMDQSMESKKAGHGIPVYPQFELFPGATVGEKSVLGMENTFQVTIRALTVCEVYVFLRHELMNLIGAENVERMKRVFQSDPKFKVRLRCFRIAKIKEVDMERMKRQVLSLPPDTVTRSWKTNDETGTSSLGAVFVDANTGMNQQQPQKVPPLLANQMGDNGGDDDHDDDLRGESEDGDWVCQPFDTSINEIGSVVGDEGGGGGGGGGNSSGSFISKVGSKSTPTKKLKAVIQHQVVVNKVETLSVNLENVKSDVSEIKSLLRQSMEDNANQMLELRQLLLSNSQK